MLKNYLKIAWKVLLRRKFFTFVSLFGITFTLVVLMVVAAFVDTLLYPAEPGSRFDRTVIVNRIEIKNEKNHIYSLPSYYFLNRYVRSMNTPELISFHSRAGETVSYVNGRKLELSLKHTDAVFWDVMELDFIEGRPFDTTAVNNADRVAVINDRTAEQVFGNEPCVGKWLETTDGSYRIVGVIPHKKITMQESYADLYVPLTLDRSALTGDRLYSRYTAYLVGYKGVSTDVVTQEFDQRMEQVREDYKGEFDTIECEYGTPAELYISFILDNSPGGPTVAIAGIVLLMLLFMAFPAINLVNINISRIIERSSEIGVRRAFGASKRTLIGQFLTENILLTFIGGTIALILSIIVLKLIGASGLVPYGDISFNLKVFGCAIALTAFFGVFSGVLPAWRMSRLHPVDALKGGDA